MLKVNNKIIKVNNKWLNVEAEPPVSGYTYFLWYVERQSGNATSFMQQDFALYDSNAPTTKITGFDCITGKTSSNPGSENYPMGFDDNSNTKWYSDNTWPNWAIFTKNTLINPVGISYMTGNDHSLTSNRAPRNYKLCGSNVYTTDPDSSDWTVIYQITDDMTFNNVSGDKQWVDKYF